MIKIDQVFFMEIFAADDDYQNQLTCLKTYLDVTNGSLLYVATNMEEAEMEFGDMAAEEFVQNSKLLLDYPDDYLRIPSMRHSDHHHVMQQFLCTYWTPDQARRDKASKVYYPRKSIGCWLREVNDNGAVEAYNRFRDIENIKRAETFLRENGVNFVWNGH